MKNKIFGTFAAACSFFSNVVSAQQSNYCSINIGAGDLLYHTISAPLQISFPYTATNALGVTSQHTFISKKIYPFKKGQLGPASINLEFGWQHNFVAAEINTFNNCANVAVGTGYNFYFDLFGGKRKKEERDFVFRPSLGLQLSIYAAYDDSKNYLGEMDNKDETLDILGYEAAPEYSYKQGRSSNTVTVQVKTTDVIFYQRFCALTPKASFGINPLKHILHLEAEVCYFIPIDEKGGIQLIQDDDNRIKGSPGIIELNRQGLAATLNNQSITSSPYSFRGFFLGINVGLNMPDRIFKKSAHRK